MVLGARSGLRLLPRVRFVAVLAQRGLAESWSVCAGTLETPTHLSTVEAWWVSEASDYAARLDLPERATE